MARWISLRVRLARGWLEAALSLCPLTRGSTTLGHPLGVVYARSGCHVNADAAPSVHATRVCYVRLNAMYATTLSTSSSIEIRSSTVWTTVSSPGPRPITVVPALAK